TSPCVGASVRLLFRRPRPYDSGIKVFCSATTVTSGWARRSDGICSALTEAPRHDGHGEFEQRIRRMHMRQGPGVRKYGPLSPCSAEYGACKGLDVIGRDHRTPGRSRTPLTSNPTTGRPIAIASSPTRGRPSHREVWTRTWACSKYGTTSCFP